MSLSKISRNPVENRLLAALPYNEYKRLLPHLELIHLAKNKIVYEIGDTIRHFYFPSGGMLSLLSVSDEGEIIEVGCVGNEGVIGIPVILRGNKMPYRITVQIPAHVRRIKVDALKAEYNKGGKLQDLLLRYANVLIMQFAQSAICQSFHTREQRLCRWLLMARDRTNSDNLQFTQEIISLMLGAPRTGVTMTAGALRKAELIHYNRGIIQILNRPGLEQAACSCYQIINRETRNLLVA